MKRGNGATLIQTRGCPEFKTHQLFVLRSQKAQGQKRFREAVAGEEQGGGKAKKRRKNGAESLPEVTRVEVEEVSESEEEAHPEYFII